MPRPYAEPLDPEPIEGTEVVSIRFRMDGNAPKFVVRISEGYVKEEGGVDQSNNLGFPLWKERGKDDSREIEMDDAVFADIIQSKWSILETAGQTRKKRLYQFLQEVGWAVYDAVNTVIPPPL